MKKLFRKPAIFVFCSLLAAGLFCCLSAAGAYSEVGLIVIDPGHGGYEAGIKVSDLREKDIVLSLASRLQAALRAEGKQVFLTRSVDRQLSIGERIAALSKRPPDALLSLHLSGTDKFAVYTTWYRETEEELTLREYYRLSSRQRRHIARSRALSGAVEKALKEEFGADVFHREMALPLLSHTGAPALLIECPSKGMIYDEETKNRIARAITKAMLFYEYQ